MRARFVLVCGRSHESQDYQRCRLKYYWQDLSKAETIGHLVRAEYFQTACGKSGSGMATDHVLTLIAGRCIDSPMMRSVNVKRKHSAPPMWNHPNTGGTWRVKTRSQRGHDDNNDVVAAVANAGLLHVVGFW